MAKEECPYCSEFKRGSLKYNNKDYGNRILFSSDNFSVFPSIGQIIEGYLLIASKEHYTGIGQVPSKSYGELESVCKKVREVLAEVYGPALFFEHGSISEMEKGGCCITHAHLHAVPLRADILSDLSKCFLPKKIDSFDGLKEQFNSGIPYFFYESNSGDKYLFDINEIVPSQYIRQILSVKIGKPERWDWRVCPGIEELIRTRDSLKDKF